MGAVEKRNMVNKVIAVIAVVVLVVVVAIMWCNDDSLPKWRTDQLLGVVSITTFLLGFASVRLQSKLEDSRSAVARQVDRVLEQNANQDLLPFPTSFSRYAVDEDFKPWDILTVSTIALTVFIFLASSGKISGDDWFQLLVLQLVHLVIVIIGSIGPYLAKKQFKKYEETQPFHLYENLEKSLVNFLEKEHDLGRQQVLVAANKLASSIPEWCWLDLVRGSLGDLDYRKEHKSHFQRLHRLASKTKEDDDYSLIAFVWSAYLLGPADDKHRLVKNSDLEQIMRFSKAKKKIRKPDAYAEMVLREAMKFRGTEGDSASLTDAAKDDSVKKRVKEHQKEVWSE